MTNCDSIYGQYNLPAWVETLVGTPVIQRLRWVALSNIPSLSYPMISGVSRYAHSLGVAHLANMLVESCGISDAHSRSLLFACILHDAGMPPLGHLTEESLGLLGVDFDHEKSLRIILLDDGRRFQHMPDGEKIGITKAIYEAHADVQEIFDAITGQGSLGKYICSDIDVDNIDNVIRLYRLIFQDKVGYTPEQIAVGYFSDDGDSEKHKVIWDGVRFELYTKLMFSLEDFAQKATMKRLIKAFMARAISKVGEHEAVDAIRFLNDFQFLNNITSSLSGTKHECSVFSGKFDRLSCYGWVDSIDKEQLRNTREALSNLEEGYYFDYIPDKRFKMSRKNKERGALLGVFCRERGTKKMDKRMIYTLLELIPNLRVSYTPAQENAQQQTLFI